MVDTLRGSQSQASSRVSRWITEESSEKRKNTDLQWVHEYFQGLQRRIVGCPRATHWSILRRHQAVNDADRVDRQSPDQLLDNEILVAETKLKKAKASQGTCCGASDRKVAQLEARLAKLRLVKDDRATFDVVVPPGGRPGAVLQVTDPMGRIVNATVPDGLGEGDTFSLPYVDRLPIAAATATPANTPLSQAAPSSSSSGGGAAPVGRTVTVGGDGEPSGSSGPSSGHQSVISEQPTLQSDPS